jgi:hypothetical protein
MLKNLQVSIVGKIATSKIQDYRSTTELLEAVIPLGFFRASTK